jgi:hypothetical protein
MNNKIKRDLDIDDVGDEVLAEMSPLYTQQPTSWQMLQPFHQRAIVALINKRSIAEAAEQCGIEPRTIHKYLRNPLFRAAYRECRAEALHQAIGALTSSVKSAVDTIHSVMTDADNLPRDRLSAAKMVLEYSIRGVESDTLAARVEQLERTLQQLEESTDDDSNAA